jgi:hypothetical protein
VVPLLERCVVRLGCAMSNRQMSPGRSVTSRRPVLNQISPSTQRHVIVVDAAAGDVRGCPVVFQVAHERLHQQGVAGHPHPRGEMEILLGGERDQVADICELHAQRSHRIRAAYAVAPTIL